MPNWLQMGTTKKPDDGVVEITPQQLSETLTTTKTELETRLTNLGKSIEEHPTLLAMKKFLDDQQASREEAARRAAETQQQTTQQQFSEIDPTMRQYVDASLKPIADAAIWQQGNEIRRSIFDNAEAYPYYSGVLKDKIDTMLDAQPASQRANPDVIRNVYKIVSYDHQKEIDEGKHKSRMSSSSSSGTGTGAPGGNTKGELPVLTAQMKSVAKAMGMTEQDYATSMKELVDAGEYA